MKRHILIVDDDHQIRDVLRRKLERCGYKVSEAANGREAIECIEAEVFDLVIADILMPEKDGLEVIMYLQREQPMTKSIVISAPSNRVFLQSAELLGATRVVEKPFELDEIEAAVKEVFAP